MFTLIFCRNLDINFVVTVFKPNTIFWANPSSYLNPKPNRWIYSDMKFVTEIMDRIDEIAIDIKTKDNGVPGGL